MKKTTFLAAVMLFVTIGAFAQVAETVRITKEMDNGRKETVTFVERLFSSKLQQTLPDWYYGFLNMTSNPFGPEAHVPLRSSSFEWGIYNQHALFTACNEHLGMSWGLGISNSYNYFSHDVVLRVDDERKAYFQSLNAYSSEEGNGPVNNFAHRSFLRYWSLRLPLMIQVQWDINDTPVALAAGVEAEWRFGVRSFARYGGSKHTITKNLDYSPVGVNALFSLAIDNFVLFARYGLTDFFNVKDSRDEINNMYQMSIGLGFNID
jgi:hypothetical protein